MYIRFFYTILKKCINSYLANKKYHILFIHLVNCNCSYVNYEMSLIMIISICRGRELMVVGLKAIYAIRAYDHHLYCEFDSHPFRGVFYKLCVIKFASGLWRVGGFLWVFLFLPQIKIWPSQVTDKLYHTELYRVHLGMGGNQAYRYI